MQTYVCLETEFGVVDRIKSGHVEQVIPRRHPVKHIRFRQIGNHKVNRIRVFIWTHDANVYPLMFSVHTFQVFPLGPLEPITTKIGTHLLFYYFKKRTKLL